MGIVFRQKFLVVDKLGLRNVGIILGLDAIREMGLNVLTQEGKIVVTLEGKNVPIEDTRQTTQFSVVENIGVFSIASRDDIVVPPNTAIGVELEVGKKVSKYVKPGKGVLVTPCKQFEEYIPYDLVSEVNEGQITINFLNMGNYPLRIKEGTNIAEIDSKIEVMQVAGVELKVDSERLSRLQQEVLPSVPNEYKRILTELLTEYQCTFALENEPTGSFDDIPLHIETGDELPVYTQPYRIPYKYQEEVDRQLKKLEKEGIIRKSSSPWQSPIVLVKKKDNSIRLCVDYRKLNKITKGDAFPLPVIEELLVKVRDSKYFSTLDLKSGYHQIAIREEDRQKTAFSAGDNQFDFSKIPFGLKSAPNHFSRVMQSVLSGILGKNILVYLDDIVVLGNTIEEHVGNLVAVLETLRRNNLKINVKKTQFFKQEVEFLGHIINAEGIKPIHDKVRSIKEFPTPVNSKKVASFLGLASYYRRYIKDFAKKARPLDELRTIDKF